MALSTQPGAARVSDRLRHIADHLDLLHQIPFPFDATHGDRALTVEQMLRMCLDAVSTSAAANSRVRSPRPCLLVSRLTNDGLLGIIAFLDPQSLVRFSMTCTALTRFVNRADYIWRALTEDRFPMWCIGIRDQPKNALADQTSVWRKFFTARERADYAWKSPSAPVQVFVKRFLRGIHALYFDRESLLLGSGQFNEVLSFDLKTGRPHSGAAGPGMFGHSQAVTALRPLKQNPDLLMTSSLDTSLRLFNRKSMQLLKAYLGHTDKIWCVDVHENRVFSGSSDKTVRIWDLDTTESVGEPLRSHRTSISAIKVMTAHSAPLLLTGSAGNTIRVWDIANGEPRCIEKLRGHTKGVFSLQATPNVLMSGSLDNVIKVWDPRQAWRLIYDLRMKDANGRDLISYTEDQETNIGVIAFQCDDTKVVSGGPDRILRIWDLRKRQIVNELAGHEHWITTLQFDDNKIVTGSRDKTVRFWDIHGRMTDEVSLQFNDPEDNNPQLPPALGPPAVGFPAAASP